MECPETLANCGHRPRRVAFPPRTYRALTREGIENQPGAVIVGARSEDGWDGPFACPAPRCLGFSSVPTSRPQSPARRSILGSLRSRRPVRVRRRRESLLVSSAILAAVEVGQKWGGLTP